MVILSNHLMVILSNHRWLVWASFDKLRVSRNQEATLRCNRPEIFGRVYCRDVCIARNWRPSELYKLASKDPRVRTREFRSNWKGPGTVLRNLDYPRPLLSLKENLVC